MKLFFRQRFFSWFDSYEIFDESGNTVYIVKGKLAWGHKLVIYDNTGREVGMVKQEVITLLPRFGLYIGGNQVGTLRREFTLFTPKYNIDYNGWYIEGNWIEWNYHIDDSRGQKVAYIDKEIFHMTDCYAIDVDRNENALGALMVVLAIDAEKCSRNN